MNTPFVSGKSASRIIHHRFGEPRNVLALEDCSSQPPLEQGEIRVRMSRSMIHPGDLQLVAARYSPSQDDIPGGRIPGSEGVGIIEEAAPGSLDGKNISVGTRVAFLADSAWQSSVILPADALVAVPDDITDDIATQMLVNTITARHVLRSAVRTLGRKPSRIVLTAAASAVGKLITALARQDGISLIRLVRSSESAARLAELLPGDDIISTSAVRWQDAVRHTASNDIPIIIDGVGGSMIAESGRLLNTAGALVSFGLLDGGPADLTMFLPKALTLRGATIGTWQDDTTADERSQDIAAAIEIARSVPEVFSGASIFSLSDFRRAIDAVSAPAKQGNVLLSFSSI